MSNSGITVNGVPLEQHVAVQVGKEIHQTRESENRYKLYRPIKSRKWNVSGERSAGGQVVYRKGQKETHVIIAGMVFPWEKKAPYVRSGKSILGGLEFNPQADEIKCHECGEWHRKLSAHIRKHKVLPREYKTGHGLAQRRALVTPSLSNAYAKAAKENSAFMGEIQKPKRLPAIHNNHARAAATVRKRAGLGFSVSPETANLRGACMEQVKNKIRTLAASLGRTPTRLELNEIGVYQSSVKRLFGISVSKLFRSIGIQPNTTTFRIQEKQHVAETLCR